MFSSLVYLFIIISWHLKFAVVSSPSFSFSARGYHHSTKLVALTFQRQISNHEKTNTRFWQAKKSDLPTEYLQVIHSLKRWKSQLLDSPHCDAKDSIMSKAQLLLQDPQKCFFFLVNSVCSFNLKNEAVLLIVFLWAHAETIKTCLKIAEYWWPLFWFSRSICARYLCQ